MTRGEIELEVGDVSNMEARVVARYRGVAGGADEAGTPIVLRGTLRGPYCDNAHTLPADFAFRDSGPTETAVAEAMVTDPCLWSVDLPHLYQADVQAIRGEEIVAEYHGKVGLRPTGPVKTWE
ncbi:MAG: hypothetical protein WD971_13720 [Pirellulales bacterium]